VAGAASAKPQPPPAASANQQAIGVKQLNEGIRNIDNITNQNVDAIRDIEKSAQTLSELSQELDSLSSAGVT
jgi:methyl-accepting chemotaxis protein